MNSPTYDNTNVQDDRKIDLVSIRKDINKRSIPSTVYQEMGTIFTFLIFNFIGNLHLCGYPCHISVTIFLFL